MSCIVASSTSACHHSSLVTVRKPLADSHLRRPESTFYEAECITILLRRQYDAFIHP
jgi:hypothetical protein